jgi:hypothetical protein
MIPPYFIGVLDGHFPPDNDDVMILDAPIVLIDSRGNRHEAPKDLETDGASVRKLLCLPVIGWLVQLVLRGNQFTGPIRPAAVVHDALYARALESTAWAAFISPAREIADRALFDGMRARYVVVGEKVIDRKPASWFSAAVVHFILRVAGWAAWIEDSRAARSLAKNEPGNNWADFAAALAALDAANKKLIEKIGEGRNLTQRDAAVTVQQFELIEARVIDVYGSVEAAPETIRSAFADAKSQRDRAVEQIRSAIKPIN